MFTTFPDFFTNTYGFTTGTGGLMYLGLGVGFFSATIFGAKFADQVYHYVRIFSIISLGTTCLILKLAFFKKWRNWET
jgi:predicted MFS family arabinose efflux permease